MHWSPRIWKDILESDVIFLGNPMRPTFISPFIYGYRQYPLRINEIKISIRIPNRDAALIRIASMARKNHRYRR